MGDLGSISSEITPTRPAGMQRPYSGRPAWSDCCDGWGWSEANWSPRGPERRVKLADFWSALLVKIENSSRRCAMAGSARPRLGAGTL